MDDFSKRLNEKVNEVNPDDPFGRTHEELIADKLLEDALAGRRGSRKLLRDYIDRLRDPLHRALDKKIQHATAKK